MKMVVFIKVICKIIKDMVEENSFLVMGPFIKDTGRMIYHLDLVD